MNDFQKLLPGKLSWQKGILKKRQVSNWQNFYHLFLAKLDQLICFCLQLISQPSVLFLDEFLFLLNSLFTELRHTKNDSFTKASPIIIFTVAKFTTPRLNITCSQKSPCGIKEILSNINNYLFTSNFESLRFLTTVFFISVEKLPTKHRLHK